ncbi:hypothetical protein GCM10010411_29440 [Actinomadura fulvescens]|uniref:Response regulator n=1 Tax=Actinomadura fulvescens TaxID=46160 RepID=A0ABN3PSU7_9ACTN
MGRRRRARRFLTFAFSAKSQEAPAGWGAMSLPRGARLLVVEDEPDIRELRAVTLGYCGWAATTT